MDIYIYKNLDVGMCNVYVWMFYVMYNRFCLEKQKTSEEKKIWCKWQVKIKWNEMFER